MAELEQARLLGGLGQDVPRGTDEGHHRHDQLFADGVDRWVGHLGEELFEIPVEELGLLREHGRGFVGAHRAHRLVAAHGHGVQDEVYVLARVSEELLSLDEIAGLGGRRSYGSEEAVDGDAVLLHPTSVRPTPRQPGLDLHVFEDPARGQVGEDDLPRPERSFLLDLLRGEVEDPRLGGEDHEAVLGDGIAGRTQSVPVKQGTDGPPVAEGDGGGAVPRLHQAGVVFEKTAQVGSHRVFRAPGLWDQHQERVVDVPAARRKKLEHVVEAGGVAGGLVGHRQQLGEVVAEEVGL